MQSDLPSDPPSNGRDPSLSPNVVDLPADELTAEEWAELERATNPDIAEDADMAEDPDIAEDTAQPTEPNAAEDQAQGSPVPDEGDNDRNDPAEIAPTSVTSEPGETRHDPQVAAAPTAAVETAPEEAAPVEAAPVETAPVETAPVETAPVETAPVETAPEEITPEELALAATAPEETAPEQIAPKESVTPPRAADPEGAAEDAAPAKSALAMALPRIIAVANQKGGVGKTTTTVNLAACLAELGHRTLLVDLDPQANASTGLGLEPRELEHSIYHVMLHDQDADSVIEPTEVKNLFILPSSLDLAGAEIELVGVMSREHRLRMAIESVIDDYDYVLIDCPPSLGLLTINALTAAKEVLVPIQCEYYALEGLGQLMQNVELVRANLNPTLQISHIVLVMFDPRTKLAGQVVDEVRKHFGDTVCTNVIPRTVRLSEAPSFGQPITTFDSGSRGAAAYRAVAKEVLGGQA